MRQNICYKGSKKSRFTHHEIGLSKEDRKPNRKTKLNRTDRIETTIFDSVFSFQFSIFIVFGFGLGRFDSFRAKTKKKHLNHITRTEPDDV
jgi:hypothetical protein